MIKFQTDKTSTHVVAFRLFKPLTTEDVGKLSNHLEERLKKDGNINLYIEIDDSLEESFENIIEHFKVGLTMFLTNAKRFQRIAIVTNKDWLKNIANTKEKYFAIDTKGFSFDKKQEALDWVATITTEVDIMFDTFGQHA